MDSTKEAFETSRPNAVVPNAFYEKSGLWEAEDNYAHIRLFYGKTSDEVAKIEIEFYNDQNAEFQRPNVKRLWKISAPGEAINDLVDWTYKKLESGSPSTKETQTAIVTLAFNSQKAILTAIPKKDKVEKAPKSDS